MLDPIVGPAKIWGKQSDKVPHVVERPLDRARLTIDVPDCEYTLGSILATGGSSMAEISRTKLRRKARRGSHNREVIDAILDESQVCHLGVTDENGCPVVTPTLHVRVEEKVYVHGSAASRTIFSSDGSEICLTATLLDGLVLGRSAMHHSANYRSVMLFGQGTKIEDAQMKCDALKALIEKLVPGRWADVRKPTEKELRATSVLCIPLDDASAKIRNGPPSDDEADLDLPVWAGVLDLYQAVGSARADQHLSADVVCPEYVSDLIR